jgi:hypothetical protein
MKAFALPPSQLPLLVSAFRNPLGCYGPIILIDPMRQPVEKIQKPHTLSWKRQAQRLRDEELLRAIAEFGQGPQDETFRI